VTLLVPSRWYGIRCYEMKNGVCQILFITKTYVMVKQDQLKS